VVRGMSHTLVGTVLVIGTAACQSGTAESRPPDTPALLRVIARSHGELVPPPATDADRHRRAVWMQASARPQQSARRKTLASPSIEGEMPEGEMP
jgi:hypothetical protein